MAISWIDNVNLCLRVAELNAGTWRYEEAVATTATAYNCGICYDAAGALHVLYQESDNSLYWGKRTTYGGGYTFNLVDANSYVAEYIDTATLLSQEGPTIIYDSASGGGTTTAAVWNGSTFDKATSGGEYTRSNATKSNGKTYVFVHLKTGGEACLEWDGLAWTELPGDDLIYTTHLAAYGSGLMWYAYDLYPSSAIRYGMPSAYSSTGTLNASAPYYINLNEYGYTLHDGTILWAGGYGNVTHSSNQPAVHYWDGAAWTPTNGAVGSPVSTDSDPSIYARASSSGQVHQVYTSLGDVYYSYKYPGGAHGYMVPSAPPLYAGTDYIAPNSCRIAVQGSLAQYESI